MATKKTPARKAAPRKTSSKTAGTFRAKIRMYRQGLGDCFLITIPAGRGKPFYFMIDCGVILGTKNPRDSMTKVVDDIVKITGGHVDVLAATHEHWDHLSGFVQARDSFENLSVGEVWLAWTENPKDALAKKLRGERANMRTALAVAETRMRFGGAADSASELHGMLEFFGAAGSGTTGEALKIVHQMSPAVRFCLPSDDPRPLAETGVRSYVLGPPHDEKWIKKFNPSKSHSETYGIDSMNLFMSSVAPTLLSGDDDAGQPFDPQFQIPLQAAQQVSFFQSHYWGEDASSTEKDQSWRVIDTAWLDASSTMALQLDSATNNTSLVLAFELPGGDVLLFAADAQVGNWLSWQDLSWGISGEGAASGPALLNRTIVYKVGHHGSHNATLREKGLEMMPNLQTALIPVDHQMALLKRWGNMPLIELLDALNEKTRERVIRVDEDLPAALAAEVIETDLFFELTV
jgi:beta-lactamase superfamily II metal-dependent hydrolase